MNTLFQDLRYGARTLLRKPGFTLIAIITLGLGFGANIAIFSLVNTVTLRPLPVAAAERIVEVTPLGKDASEGAFSYPVYKDFRDKNEVFDGLAAILRCADESESERRQRARLGLSGFGQLL